jgi:hypothetical protein
VRDLVALHDGTIAIDEAPGGGARFTIEFGISELADDQPTRATGEFRARAGASPRG